jgi:hypothetical protein
MNRKIITAIALTLMIACAKPQNAPMSVQEQETAKKEIAGAVDVILQNLEKMDIEALGQSYSDTIGFLLITTDGTMADLGMSRNGHAAWFKSLSALDVTTAREEFRFLPGSDVICSWLGKFDMTPRTGGKLLIDRFGITFIFRKIDGQWKVIYQQSSSLPPVPEQRKK